MEVELAELCIKPSLRLKKKKKKKRLATHFIPIKPKLIKRKRTITHTLFDAVYGYPFVFLLVSSLEFIVKCVVELVFFVFFLVSDLSQFQATNWFRLHSKKMPFAFTHPQSAQGAVLCDLRIRLGEW